MLATSLEAAPLTDALDVLSRAHLLLRRMVSTFNYSAAAWLLAATRELRAIFQH